MSRFRPQTPWEKQRTLKSFRPMFIEEVTKGKKTEWNQLNFIEKIKVDQKCQRRYSILRF